MRLNIGSFDHYPLAKNAIPSSCSNCGCRISECKCSLRKKKGFGTELTVLPYYDNHSVIVEKSSWINIKLTVQTMIAVLRSVITGRRRTILVVARSNAIIRLASIIGSRKSSIIWLKFKTLFNDLFRSRKFANNLSRLRIILYGYFRRFYAKINPVILAKALHTKSKQFLLNIPSFYGLLNSYRKSPAVMVTLDGLSLLDLVGAAEREGVFTVGHQEDDNKNSVCLYDVELPKLNRRFNLSLLVLLVVAHSTKRALLQQSNLYRVFKRVTRIAKSLRFSIHNNIIVKPVQELLDKLPYTLIIVFSGKAGGLWEKTSFFIRNFYQTYSNYYNKYVLLSGNNTSLAVKEKLLSSIIDIFTMTLKKFSRSVRVIKILSNRGITIDESEFDKGEVEFMLIKQCHGNGEAYVSKTVFVLTKASRIYLSILRIVTRKSILNKSILRRITHSAISITDRLLEKDCLILLNTSRTIIHSLYGM